MDLLVVRVLPFLILILVGALFIWMRTDGSPQSRQAGERFGIVEADEMERQIRSKAMGIAYQVLLDFLVLYQCYTSLFTDNYEPWVGLAILIAIAVQGSATLVLRHRNTAGDEEYRPYPVWKTVLWVLGIIIIVLAACLMLVFAVLIG